MTMQSVGAGGQYRVMTATKSSINLGPSLKKALKLVCTGESDPAVPCMHSCYSHISGREDCNTHTHARTHGYLMNIASTCLTVQLCV